MPTIEFRNVSVYYQNNKEVVAALDNFNAVFADGINVIVGYSGCGKTTLLKTLAGQLGYNGTITVDGVNLDETTTQERNFAYVSQEYVLYPRYTVFDNIAFPLKQIGAKRDEIYCRVKEIAAVTGLTACLTRNPKYISGGQQQRVAIARALVKNPSVCLLDEPFSNVDNENTVQTRAWLKSVFRQTGCTALYVTHDFNEAIAMADKLYVMNCGKIEVCGSAKDVLSGNSVVVNSFRQETTDFDE